MVDANALEQRLAQVDLFSGLPAKVIKKIAKQGHEVTHKPGHEVATEGESGIAFHLLLAGSADVEVGGAPRRTLGAGDYFGEIAVLDKKPRSATVRAGDDGMTTFALSAWQFSPMLDEHPELARALLLKMAERLRAAEKSGAQD